MADDVVERVARALKETPQICQRHNAPEDADVCYPECPGLWKHDPDYPRMARAALEAVGAEVAQLLRAITEVWGPLPWTVTEDERTGAWVLSNAEHECLAYWGDPAPLQALADAFARLRALRPKEENRD